MLGIPRAPLALGLAGLLPFAIGALVSTATEYDYSQGGYPLFVAKDGLDLLALYGTIILAFMSGILWGFATKAHDAKATTGYLLSVIPALWALFMRGTTTSDTLFYLIIGFLGLLVLDYFFSREGLTPPWWMRLRILLTTVVVFCLAIGAIK